MKKYYQSYLLFFTLFSAVTFLYLGFSKPLWLDEILTLQIIKDDSPIQIINKLFLGSDTNAPLYFVLIKIYSSLFGIHDISLKLFSALIVAIALWVNLKLINEYTDHKLDIYITFLFLFVSQSVSSYLLTEVRTYPLVYLLSSILIYQLFKKGIARIPMVSTIALVTVALMYTHYFSFYLISALIIYELFTKRRKKIVYGMLIGLLLFIPWLPAVYNQLMIGGKIVHHGSITISSLLEQYFFLIGKGGILLIILLIGYAFLQKRKIVITNICWLSIIAFVPVVNIILSYYGYSVHTPRYFLYSLIPIIIIFTILLSHLNTNVVFRLMIIVLISSLAANRIYEYNKHITKSNHLIQSIKKLEYYNLPIVCESPHLQYPLEHYLKHQKIFFLLDSLSAFSSGNIKNAHYDFLLLQNYKNYYDLKNIVYFDAFQNKYNEFLLINENDRMLYEVRYLYNRKYKTELLFDNIYLIKINEI